MAGRSNIATIVGRTELGDPITVGDRIINALRAGAYFEQACAAAGVGKETAYGWLRLAGQVRIRTAGDPDLARLTDHERQCFRFSDAVLEAEGQWEIGALATLEQLARGGIEQLKTVVKVDVTGNVLETTRETKHTLPSAAVLMWRLERKHPERYGRRPEGDSGSGERSLSIDDRAVALVETFSAYLQGREDAKAEQVKITKPRRKRRARVTPAP